MSLIVEVQVYVRVRDTKTDRIVGNACSGIATHPGQIGKMGREAVAADVVSWAMTRLRNELEHQE